MAVTLTADMRAIIQAAHRCFAATVSPDGMPNLSPKGMIRVWDDQHHRSFGPGWRSGAGPFLVATLLGCGLDAEARTETLSYASSSAA